MSIRLRIDDEQMVEDFFADTRLISIVAPIKDYSFIWSINYFLGYSFKNASDAVLQYSKKGRQYFFNLFEYKMPHRAMTHLLYENQHDGEFLLPEFKHLDFLWLIQDCSFSEDEFQGLIKIIKNIPHVQFVNEMAHEKIKNKKHLII